MSQMPIVDGRAEGREGWRRLAIVASIIWFGGYYLYASAEINLWTSWIFSSWRTTCADVFGVAHGLVSNCGSYGDSFSAWWEIEGPSARVFVWWVGPIAALWSLFSVVPWVLTGFSYRRAGDAKPADMLAFLDKAKGETPPTGDEL